MTLYRKLLGIGLTLAATVSLPAIGAAADAPVKGGTLVYLEQQAHTNLYSPAGGFYPNGGILNQIIDKLTYQNPKTLEIEPWIAEFWTVNADATDDRTRAYFALPNPKLEVFPIGEVAAIGRRFGIPLIVDNTAAPLIIRPLEHGAAVAVYFATKYIGGHGTSIGGAIIDGGNFP